MSGGSLQCLYYQNISNNSKFQCIIQETNRQKSYSLAWNLRKVWCKRRLIIIFCNHGIKLWLSLGREDSICVLSYPSMCVRKAAAVKARHNPRPWISWYFIRWSTLNLTRSFLLHFTALNLPTCQKSTGASNGAWTLSERYAAALVLFQAFGV